MSRAPLQARIRDARARLSIAEGECAHWDYENTEGGTHACCEELRAATESLKRLRREAQLPTKSRRTNR
jgi:hypothetical protein